MKNLKKQFLDFTEKGSDNMAINADVIENLARRLEREIILNDLENCKTLEDYENVTKKYKELCNPDGK